MGSGTVELEEVKETQPARLKRVLPQILLIALLAGGVLTFITYPGIWYSDSYQRAKTAVQLLRAIKKSGKKLSELAQLMQVYPQVILNVRADKEMKRMVKVDEGVLKRQQQLEEGMNGNGRILVRPSGTEPVIRIMVEGLDGEAIMNAAKSMEQIIIERLGYNEDCKGLERI